MDQGRTVARRPDHVQVESKHHDPNLPAIVGVTRLVNTRPRLEQLRWLSRQASRSDALPSRDFSRVMRRNR
jgi:hypothetical protein